MALGRDGTIHAERGGIAKISFGGLKTKLGGPTYVRKGVAVNFNGVFMSQREQFSSRLGFLLIAAGCAIGLGNVWRFPYITGQYGGAIFVMLYLVFLIILGVPL